MKNLILLIVVVFAQAIATSHAQTPTPPPLKPYLLDWDDNPVADKVLSYNVYKKSGTTYAFTATVTASNWTIPATITGGSILAVTASNGNAESARSVDVTVPTISIPSNVKIIITLP